MWDMMNIGGNGLGMGVMMLSMLLFSLLFLVLLVLGVVALARYLGSTTNRPNHNPLETLKELYARGEIDQKEFEQKKKDLA